MSTPKNKVNFSFYKDLSKNKFKSLSGDYFLYLNNKSFLEPFEIFNPVLRDFQSARFVKKNKFVPSITRSNLLVVLKDLIIITTALSFIIFITLGTLLSLLLVANILLLSPMIIIMILLSLSLFSGIFFTYLDYKADKDCWYVPLSYESERVFEFLDMVTDYLNQNSYDDKRTTLKKLLNSPDHLRQLNGIYQSSKDRGFWERQIKNMNIDYDFYRGTNDFSETDEYRNLKNNLHDIQNIITHHPNEKEETIPFDAEKILKDGNWESLEQIKQISDNLESLMSQYWTHRETLSQQQLYQRISDSLSLQKLHN